MIEAARFLSAILVVAMSLLYTGFVISGRIDEKHRIDVVTLVVLFFAFVVVAVIISPGFIDRLKMFQVSSFKLEMLEKVQQKQIQQENKLDDITLILPLLFPVEERKLLIDIASNKTSDYKGNHSIRSQLRRFRGAGLLISKPGTHIADAKDNTIVDIALLVELTSLGKRCASKIKEAEVTEKDIN